MKRLQILTLIALCGLTATPYTTAQDGRPTHPHQSLVKKVSDAAVKTVHMLIYPFTATIKNLYNRLFHKDQPVEEQDDESNDSIPLDADAKKVSNAQQNSILEHLK